MVRDIDAILREKASSLGAAGLYAVSVEDLISVTCGLPFAFLILFPLPKDYLISNVDKETADGSVFSQKEREADTAADALADFLRGEGYRALSQSEKSLAEAGRFDFAALRSPLPHKTIALRAGLGWIGRNNLLVTRDYGAGQVLPSVLTDAPLALSSPAASLSCGKCHACVDACPVHVLSGRAWGACVDRDEIVDVHHCATCLRCLLRCVWTRRYARS